MTLQELIKAVKEDKLDKDQLEKYHSELCYLKSQLYLELADLKKEIESLNYYLKKLIVPPKDRENILHINNTINDISNKLDKSIFNASKALREENANSIDTNYRNKLSVINSPTGEMLKNSEINTSIRQSLSSLKINLIKETSDKLYKNGGNDNGSNSKK